MMPVEIRWHAARIVLNQTFIGGPAQTAKRPDRALAPRYSNFPSNTLR